MPMRAGLSANNAPPDEFCLRNPTPFSNPCYSHLLRRKWRQHNLRGQALAPRCCAMHSGLPKPGLTRHK